MVIYLVEIGFYFCYREVNGFSVNVGFRFGGWGWGSFVCIVRGRFIFLYSRRLFWIIKNLDGCILVGVCFRGFLFIFIVEWLVVKRFWFI